MNYYKKYLKYKNKYNSLKGGAIFKELANSDSMSDKDFLKNILQNYEKDTQGSQTEELDIISLYDSHLNLNKDKDYIILFKASWCGHCRNFEPTWQKLMNNIKHLEFITHEHDDSHSAKLMEKIKISSFPTILIYINNQYINYEGSKDYHTIYNFVSN